MSISERKSNKYVFSLKDVDTDKVENQYGITLSSNITSVEEDLPTNITKLCDLINDVSIKETVSFLDDSKKKRTCNVSMIDFSTQTDVELLRYHCYWCRHPFDTRPIGCPIRYQSSCVKNKYRSHISNDMYTINENITISKRKSLVANKDIEIIHNEYYETDGVFCSFNCCKSYIKENKTKPIYQLSLMLISKMYKELTGCNIKNVTDAPSWKLLKEYGGQMNINEFRDCFNKKEYIYNGTINTFPEFRSIGNIYEDIIRF
jgi:hypothetical protein